VVSFPGKSAHRAGAKTKPYASVGRQQGNNLPGTKGNSKEIQIDFALTTWYEDHDLTE